MEEKVRVFKNYGYIINPHHPVTVTLIGCGGNGSIALNWLARINYVLRQLDHPGLHVTAYDDDTVSEYNIGRQLFGPSDIGKLKSEVLINRINRSFGTQWEYETAKFLNQDTSNVFITCTDNIESRRNIMRWKDDIYGAHVDQNKPYYWLDIGNYKNTGQGIITNMIQNEPSKQKKNAAYNQIQNLKCVFDYGEPDEKQRLDEPSCSMFESLQRQGLFINQLLVDSSMLLLYEALTEPLLNKNGVIVNLEKGIIRYLEV